MYTSFDGWDNLGQQSLDELGDSIPRRIQASMQEDVLLGIRGTGVKVYLYDGTPCNMWFSLGIKGAEMLFLWISILFACNGSGTCGTEVMQNLF